MHYYYYYPINVIHKASSLYWLLRSWKYIMNSMLNACIMHRCVYISSNTKCMHRWNLIRVPGYSVEGLMKRLVRVVAKAKPDSYFLLLLIDNIFSTTPPGCLYRLVNLLLYWGKAHPYGSVHLLLICTLLSIIELSRDAGMTRLYPKHWSITEQIKQM